VLLLSKIFGSKASGRLFHTMNPFSVEPLFPGSLRRRGRYAVLREPGGSSDEGFQPRKDLFPIGLLGTFPRSGDDQGVISGNPGS
jgi:hypothetical protein